MTIARQRFLILSRHLISLSIVGALTVAILTVSLSAQTASQDQNADLKPNKSTSVTINGYVRDMACLIKFKKALKEAHRIITGKNR
jgi:hypothetical protein